MSGLIERARRDIRQITTSEDGFGQQLVFTKPDGTTAMVYGLASRRHLDFSPETGRPVNSRHAHVSVAEAELVSKNYTIRTNGEVNMSKHRVSWTDVSGTSKTYIIEQAIPNDVTGLVLCILGAYTE